MIKKRGSETMKNEILKIHLNLCVKEAQLTAF